jgi:hypothetical protein
MTQIARLQITLDHIKPQVLRRIEVPVDINLEALHLVMQIAMGWQNCHLWSFRTPEGEWSSTDPNFGHPTALPAEETSLAELLRRGGARSFQYRQAGRLTGPRPACAGNGPSHDPHLGKPIWTLRGTGISWAASSRC